jgi:hypothetical protein
VTIEHVAYELALDALRRQEATLSELRGRTGILLAAASLVASFLGSRALDDPGGGLVEGTALIAFLVTVLACVVILAPKASLEFSVDGYAAYEYFAERDAPLEEAQRTIAFWVTAVWNRNQPVIESLHRWFAVACVALVAQVGLWAAGLGDTLG